MESKIFNLQEVKPQNYHTPSQKYQCNSCKFIFYNSNVCLRCGSPDVVMVIED